MNLLADNINSRTITVGETTVTVYRDGLSKFDELKKPILERNVFAIHQDGKIILINTGVGNAGFGDEVGFLKHFTTEGHKPSDVTAILLTSMSEDYSGGLVGFNKYGARNGGFIYTNMKANFPNAKIYISKSEFEYWSSENIDNAAFSRASKFYVDRIVTFDFNTEILPGITAIEAPKQTPEQAIGTTIFTTSDFMFIGGLDVETTATEEQGKIWQKQATEQKLQIAGTRLPFPAVGKLTVDNKNGYNFITLEETK